MRYSKLKIGEFVRLCNNTNVEDFNLPIYGINKDKEFMPTIANTSNVDRKKYKIITKGRFIFSGMQTGRDKCIRIGLYENDFDVLVSPAYTTFEVDEAKILPEYFFMIFRSLEKDRYGAFLSDGSIRSNLDWEVFCDIELIVPKIEIQEKYVAVYKSMLKNQEVYENGLEDLKLVCDATIEKIRREMPSEKIENYIHPSDERNNNDLYDINNVKGISIQKEFIETKAKMRGVSLASYKIVKPKSFAYVTVTSRNSDKITIAYNRTNDTYIVSSSYVVFNVSKPDLLNPEYLFMFFNRSEFDRYTRFHSWGSARETFTWDDLVEVKIPIPDIKIQKSIVDIYNAYITRMEINEKLKEQIKDICPILIKGSLEEVSNNEAI